MRTSTLTSFATLASALVLGLVSAGAAPEDPGREAPTDPASVVEDLGWMAGTWSGNMWGGRFEAHYTTGAGGKLVSFSRLYNERGGKEVESYFEFEVFEPQGQTVHLQPYPEGKPAGGFTMQEHDPKARKVVFDNPDKDYPTRITYHRVEDDRFVITLSDPHGTSGKSEEFDLRAVR